MEAEVEALVIVLSSSLSKLRICLHIVTQVHTEYFPYAALCARRTGATVRFMHCK
jgi:hypothetical protein